MKAANLSKMKFKPYMDTYIWMLRKKSLALLYEQFPPYIYTNLVEYILKCSFY